jgi:hypothetical protein
MTYKLGYANYDLHYAVTIFLDLESYDFNGFDVVVWYLVC